MSAATFPVNQHLRPPWEAGKSGNPAGRPKGARHKIAEAFLKDFLSEWETSGPAALQRLATSEPATFVKLAADLAVPAIKASGRENSSDAGVLFDAASFVAGALVGRSNAGHALPLPNRSVLATTVCVEQTGCGKAVDTGEMPGGGA